MTQTFLGHIISISDFEATCDCNSKQYIHYMIAPLHCTAWDWRDRAHGRAGEASMNGMKLSRVNSLEGR